MPAPDIRSLEEPESLRGASISDIRGLIPADWEVDVTRTEDGIRAFRPGTNRSDYVRLMPGNAAAPDSLHKGPRVIVTLRGEKWVIPLEGNSAAG